METLIFNQPTAKANSMVSFPGFPYSATALKRFNVVDGQYTILLKSGQVVQFNPKEPMKFKSWLEESKIADASSFYL